MYQDTAVAGGLVVPLFYRAVDVTRGRGAGFEWGTLGFPVPAVLHGVSRSAAGELGIVLVNWTAADGSFVGRLDPTLYGFGVEQELSIVRLIQGEASALVARFAGVVALGLGGVRDEDVLTVDLGCLPAHSVAVFVVHESEALG